MKLHNLKPAKGSVRKNKRLGRGEGSKRGGTSTRGHKGAKSRSGYSKKRGFEGGQMPLQKRVPKRGFYSRNRVTFVPMNFSRLEEISKKHGTSEMDMDFFVSKGYISADEKIKVLATGELSSPISISAHACSVSAKMAIEKAGGSISIIS